MRPVIGDSWRRLVRFFFGDDVFISYARRDASGYALGLASELTKKELSCFLDQWGTPPGKKLPPPIKRAIKRCGMFVLLGSPSATDSVAVAEEVKLFLGTGRPLIPVSFEGSLEKAGYYAHIAGVSISQDSVKGLQDGTPEAKVIERIVSTKGFTSRNKRLRQVFWVTVCGMVVLVAGGIVLTQHYIKQANEQRNIAQEQERIAQAQRAIAEQQKTIASALQLATQAETTRGTTADALLRSVNLGLQSLAKTDTFQGGSAVSTSMRLLSTPSRGALDFPGATAVTLSPDGTVAAITKENQVELIELPNNSEPPDQRSLGTMALNKGETVASLSNRGTHVAIVWHEPEEDKSKEKTDFPESGMIRIVDFKTRKESKITFLDNRESGVGAVALSPDAEYLAVEEWEPSGAAHMTDMKVAIWKLNTSDQKPERMESQEAIGVHCLAFHPLVEAATSFRSKRYMLACGGIRAQAWIMAADGSSVTLRSVVNTIRFGDSISAVAMCDPADKRISGKLFGIAHGSTVSVFEVSADGFLRETARAAARGPVNSLAFSSAAEAVFAIGKRAPARERASGEDEPEKATNDPKSDPQLQYWLTSGEFDLAGGVPLDAGDVTLEKSPTLTFGSDSTRLISVFTTGSEQAIRAQYLKGADGRFVRENETKLLEQCLAISADGAFYLQDNDDETKVDFVEAASGRRITVALPAEMSRVESGTIAADGTMFAIAGEKKAVDRAERTTLVGVVSVDLQDGRAAVLRTWETARKNRFADSPQLTLSRDKQIVAIAGGELEAGMWKVATGELLKLDALQAALRVWVSPRGTYCATLEEQAWKLWAIDSGKLILSSEPTTAHWGISEVGTPVAFSGDESLFAAAEVDGQAKAWRLPGAKPIFVPAFQRPIAHVAISSDGKYLALTDRYFDDEDQFHYVLHVVDLPLGDLAEEAKRRLDAIAAPLPAKVWRPEPDGAQRATGTELVILARTSGPNG